MKRIAPPREPDPQSAAPIGIGLAEARTAGEAYDRVVRAFDDGKLTPAQARIAVELVKVRSTVVAAEEFARRLSLTESAARDAQQRAALPARRAVIEAETTTPSEASE